MLCNNSDYYTFWVCPGNNYRLRKVKVKKSELGLSVITGFLCCLVGLNILLDSPVASFKTFAGSAAKAGAPLAKIKQEIVKLQSENVESNLQREHLIYKVSELALVAQTISNMGLFSEKDLLAFTVSDDNYAMGGPEIDCEEKECSSQDSEDILLLKEDSTPEYSQLSSQQLEAMLEQYKNKFNALPLLRPASEGKLTSGYGFRRSPFSGKLSMHEGIDISLKYGTAVFAAGSGVVKTVKYSSTYGNMVDIQHNDNIVTRYAHLSKSLVKPGQKISGSQKIGLAGSTGRSTGSHLHYEVIINRKQTNPQRLLALGKLIHELISL